MTVSVRPRRSALYMPGSNARALEKGRNLPADCLIMDLEDACPPDKKAEARGMISSSLREGGYGAREIMVRVNGLGSDWGETDVREMAASGADALLLPKVESPATVQKAEALMHAAGAPEAVSLWCMIETPRGILRAEEIAGASPRLGGLIMGTADLAKDLHCRHTADRFPLLSHLSRCVLVARAYDLGILDGVHFDLEDDEGFLASCSQGAALGFDGKTLIHPKTIAAANAAFGPTGEDIEESRAIITAFEATRAAGQGVAVLNGKLIEKLHVETAQRVLALADKISQLEDAAGA